MKARTRIHITPHMHWDREWYFTTEESRILLINNIEEILTRLEQDEDYPFYVLDGQTAILEDYFAIKPENRPRVRALVQAGKLIIGPWYSQTDTTVVAAESIVRNLLYGMRDCQALGDPMKIGYLPDSFGMSSQLPHIFNGFGIRHTLFWRGCSERHGTSKSEFLWQSRDGSEVVAQVLPLGYAIGKYLPEDEAGLRKRLNTYFEVLENVSETQDILLPNGHDQMPLQQNLLSVMATLKKIYPQRDFMLSRYEDVFHRIEQARDRLKTVKGEFIDGKYMRVHRTIGSTRMDIKLAHARTENKIVNVLEPLASVAWSLGFDYHHGLLEKMWKEVLKNHAHDSIGCCCSDKVHKEIMNRFELAEDMAENLIRFYQRKIVDAMPESTADKLTLFNLMPFPRQSVINTSIRLRASEFSLRDEQGRTVDYFIRDRREIDPGLVDRQIVHYGNYDPFMEYDIQINRLLPAMGYSTLWIEPHLPGSQQAALKPGDALLENDYYLIQLNPDGTLNITDKERGLVFDQALQLEDGSDDGDEYDYSPAQAEWLIYSTSSAHFCEVQHEGWQSRAILKLRMELPDNLQARASGHLGGWLDVECHITLATQSRLIEVEMYLDNQADDHRVRVLLPTPFASASVLADNQFGTISRPVKDPALEDWQEQGWKEAPIPVWNLLNYAVLSSGNEGVALITDGLREFEIIGEENNTFALTLFRSVGVLGKEELLLRPGRPSGIKLPTPDSQLRGKLSCRFSMMTFSGSPSVAGIAQHARSWLTPVQCYNKIPWTAMKLNPAGFETPTAFSLMTMSTVGCMLSAFKKAEDRDELIVRIFNPDEHQTSEGIMSSSLPLMEWKETRMDETPLTRQTEKTGEFTGVRPCQSRTFSMRIKR